jgi:hypothetical protein
VKKSIRVPPIGFMIFYKDIFNVYSSSDHRKYCLRCSYVTLIYVTKDPCVRHPIDKQI